MRFQTLPSRYLSTASIKFFVETVIENVRMVQLNESKNFKIIEPLGSGLM